jgi:hypothetical protein
LTSAITNAIPGGVSVYFRGTGPARGWVRLNPAEVGSPYRDANTVLFALKRIAPLGT